MSTPSSPWVGPDNGIVEGKVRRESDVYNDLLIEPQQKLSSAQVRKEVRAQKATALMRFKGACQYLGDCLAAHPRLYVLRLDLGYWRSGEEVFSSQDIHGYCSTYGASDQNLSLPVYHFTVKTKQGDVRISMTCATTSYDPPQLDPQIFKSFHDKSLYGNVTKATFWSSTQEGVFNGRPQRWVYRVSREGRDGADSRL